MESAIYSHPILSEPKSRPESGRLFGFVWGKRLSPRQSTHNVGASLVYSGTIHYSWPVSGTCRGARASVIILHELASGLLWVLSIGRNNVKKSAAVVIGSAIGVFVGLAINYLFGPASGTTFDERYRSRWDRALEEGREAAAAHELEMRRQFVAAKQPRLSVPEENET